MTSLINAFSHHAMPFTGRDALPDHGRSVQAGGDLEYQAVFATLALLLAGGCAVVVTALSHAF